ncbi:hypothetical protein BGZ63DRAFT_255901 [Mariannaea sp. PMI_226]|nr:hypothetical protein BGZ63DRAFT_255901 [Mariannaea sp. PMI_226]
MYRFSGRSGHSPNYVAPWELERTEGRWYHIDDITNESPVEFPVDFTIDELPQFGEEFKYKNECIEVPYALTPPQAFDSRNPAIFPHAIKTPLRELQKALGNLFSVPPDGRLPLAFETNELRFRAGTHDEDLILYLREVYNILEKLKQKDTCFFVRDLNIMLDGAYCEYSAVGEVGELEQTPHYWRMVKPALEHERNGFYVRPSQIALESMPACDAETHKREVWEKERDRWKERSQPNKLALKFGPKNLMSPRRWYRFICLKGLSSIVPPSTTVKDASKIWGCLFYNGDRERLPKNRRALIPDTFERHLSNRKIWTSVNPFVSSWRAFHLSWYQLFPNEDKSKLESSYWKWGHLHGNAGKSLQQRTVTVLYLPYCNYLNYDNPHDVSFTHPKWQREGTEFWTILLLAPPSNRDWKWDGIPLSLAILEIIRQGLEEAANSWDEIFLDFSARMEGHYPILDPARHDDLLRDDDNFSRSREYFWLMNSLDTFKVEIQDSLDEWKYFWEARETLLRACRSREPRDYYKPITVDQVRERVDDQKQRLQDRHDQFKEMRDQIHSLRESLFNASSVIESRTSTRLGQNVQLLTYVSIFYLPLGFCVALWSINETYSKSMLGLLAVLVSGGTYFVVANLKTLTYSAADLYKPFREKTISSMRGHKDWNWQDRGQKFNKFQFRRRETVPSEWYILWFPVFEILRKLWLSILKILRMVWFVLLKVSPRGLYKAIRNRQRDKVVTAQETA